MKNDKGFTLVELIVTIALLGILGTVIAVNMVGLNKNQEEKENKRISSIVESAAEAYVEKENLTGDCVTVDELISKGYLKASDVEKYKGKSVKIEDGKYTLQDGDNCQPTKKEYTVTYEPSEGGIISGNKTQQIENGEKYIFPEVERTGYTFDGWYTQKEEGTRIAKSSEDNIVANISGDQTLYAHWTAKEIIVSFKPNLEGVEKPTDITVTYDKTYGNLPTPTKTGYEFNGWFLNDDGTDGPINRDSKVGDLNPDMQSENHTLYGKWTLREYTINFDANGGSVSPSSKTYTYGQTYGSLPTPTRTGYTFLGWYTSSSSGVKVNNSDTMNYTTATTLYAHWQTITMTVTFDANGGSVSPSSKTYTYGQTYGTLPTPTKTGYDFQGWYTSTTGGNLISSITKVTKTYAHTLYAHWKDSTKPRCGDITVVNSNVRYGTWTNSDGQTYNVQCKDEGSGCQSETYSYKPEVSDGEVEEVKVITIEDNDGNTNTCSINVMIDKTVPYTPIITGVGGGSKNFYPGSGYVSCKTDSGKHINTSSSFENVSCDVDYTIYSCPGSKSYTSDYECNDSNGSDGSKGSGIKTKINNNNRCVDNAGNISKGQVSIGSSNCSCLHSPTNWLVC